MTLGDIIKEYRTAHQMSMDTFAKHAGLSKAYISMLEKNLNPVNNKPIIPSLETIKAVSSTIGMDFNDVIAMLDGSQNISLVKTTEESYSAAAPAKEQEPLTDTERQLIDDFRGLPDVFQERVLDAVAGMKEVQGLLRIDTPRSAEQAEQQDYGTSGEYVRRKSSSK